MSPLPPVEVPVDLGRDEARELAQRELADPAYAAAQPSIWQRAIEWVIDRVQEAIDAVSEAAPGGWWGILGLLLLVALGIAAIRWRAGPVARSVPLSLTVDPATSAAQFRSRADRAAASGDWATAITERMRAIVRRGQERGLIDDRPGWTADEVAAELGGRLPGAAEQLGAAARTFDDVRYGGRPATPEAYAVLSRAEDAVERAAVVPR